MAQTLAQTRQWRFFRSGGLDQVKLESPADLLAVTDLDEKLWVALACPTRGLHFDSRTLEYIDSDHDGRIRVPELKAAISWTFSRLTISADTPLESPTLPLSAINDATPEGKALRKTAQELLAAQGTTNAVELRPDDTAAARASFAATPFNGDGVIVAASLDDPAAQAAFADILGCVEPAPDLSGLPGLSRPLVETFFTQAAQYVAWHDSAQADASILPLGAHTAAAYEAFAAVKAKIDDYFTRTELAAFDARAAGLLNGDESGYRTLGATLLATTDDAIAALPLCSIGPASALRCDDTVNPAWRARLKAFFTQVVSPLHGEGQTLNRDAWTATCARFAPYAAWQSAKAGAGVEKLGIGRIRELLAGNTQTLLLQAIDRDAAQADHLALTTDLDKLVLLHRDLPRLCRNFVNFKDFYGISTHAIFQAGTLYLDQRACMLCLQLQDSARHATVAAMAGAYLAYCDCTRAGGSEKMQIVAVITDGEADNLTVGRNGVFYDYSGRDWDAVITKIIENPISLRQAFWAPYKGLVRMIETQIAQRAAAADSASNTRLEGVAGSVATADKSKTAQPKKVDVGTVAALGVAFGAIGTLVATLLGYTSGIVKLGPLAIVGAVLGILLVISGPSLIMAFIKLRKRTLGPILDGNGWAINAHARITMPLASKLTVLARLPKGSIRDLHDPFAEKKSPWPRLIAIALILWIAYTVLDRFGYVHTWSNGRIGKPHAATTDAAAPAPRP